MNRRNGVPATAVKLEQTLLAATIASLVLFPMAASAAEKADLMITNGMVLTMNPDKTVHGNGTVVVKDDKIIAVGDASIADDYQADIVLDADGDIVMPGLINTHTHVSMTVFRSLADDVPDRYIAIFSHWKPNLFHGIWCVSAPTWAMLKW